MPWAASRGDIGDIRLDDGQDGQAESWLTIETNILNAQGWDPILDSPGLLGVNYRQYDFAGAVGGSPLPWDRRAPD